MCTFKYCKQLGKCFLEETSPCRDHNQQASGSNATYATPGEHGRLRLRYNGFIEPTRFYESAFEPETYWRLAQSRNAASSATR